MFCSLFLFESLFSFDLKSLLFMFAVFSGQYDMKVAFERRRFRITSRNSQRLPIAYVINTITLDNIFIARYKIFDFTSNRTNYKCSAQSTHPVYRLFTFKRLYLSYLIYYVLYFQTSVASDEV